MSIVCEGRKLRVNTLGVRPFCILSSKKAGEQACPQNGNGS